MYITKKNEKEKDHRYHAQRRIHKNKDWKKKNEKQRPTNKQIDTLTTQQKEKDWVPISGIGKISGLASPEAMISSQGSHLYSRTSAEICCRIGICYAMASESAECLRFIR